MMITSYKSLEKQAIDQRKRTIEKLGLNKNLLEIRGKKVIKKAN